MTLYCWMRLDSRLTTSCRENFLGSVWCLYWYCWAGSEPRNEEDLLETDLLWWVVVMIVSCWWHETWTLSTAPWADLMSSPHDKLLTFYFRLYTQQSESKEKYQVGSAYFVKFETRWIGHLEGTLTWHMALENLTAWLYEVSVYNLNISLSLMSEVGHQTVADPGHHSYLLLAQHQQCCHLVTKQ